MLAKLHLIKLFFWYILRDEEAIRRQGFLPQLDPRCLNKAFEEMHAEGFADDGLFPKIRDFFLPLTISERELHKERPHMERLRQTRLAKRNRLLEDLEQYQNALKERADVYWRHDDIVLDLEKRLANEETQYTQTSTKLISSKKGGRAQPEQARELHQLHEKSKITQTQLRQHLHEIKNRKKEVGKVVNDLETNIDETKALVTVIENELAASSKHVDKRLIKPPRGLIMYGPPGTGKSDIMSKLSKKLGILMVGPPIAAGELNRPLVGQTESILIALCSRCYRVPYAMCCISIDEIDSLAPKRTQDSSEGKVDKISVLLSLIEGIKDVPNLMILCATNRLHMMDEAFLRRMSGKFFVGRPSSDARLCILRKIPDWALEPELLDRLAIATTNFSGAAVNALTRMITVKCMTIQRTQPDYQLNEIEVLKIADCAAQQYQILIGSETLPRLLLRNKFVISRNPIYQLSPRYKYTGRIIVDLFNRSIRIEICGQNGVNVINEKLAIVQHKLYPNETSVQGLLERLTAYGKDRNVQLLQLIDLHLLASQGAYDERKVYETLKDRYDEFTAYARSMIVYDLDALVGVNRSESDSNMGRSISSSVHNHSIYTYVLARFRDFVIEDSQQQTDNIERWSVAIIREPFLLRQFCADVQFARTRQEEEEIELERRKAEDLLICVKCKDFYIENENRMGSCTHHNGFPYDVAASDLRIYTSSEMTKLLNRIESDAINNPDERDRLERQKTKFKWICCDAVFTSATTGGCKKGKHGFSFQTNSEFYRPFVNYSVAQLDQVTIQQWEEACRANEEYNEKWLSLLHERRS
ncbi:unnamed protein product [Rotaria sp. Silwood1]|nr:unnamed protein product [Rotaria sp. Silwood1]CAF3892618.1 unnamed protein product [Rotaria sp. Silwood1]CAF4911359.1 unnamed protein product [Rotaria sp. Silwood1]CAF4942059.1 unnamed protein product [Rotaria sp. Silwood1]